VHLPWVGAIVQDLTPEIASHFGLRQRKGVLVRAVESSSPAAEAGVVRGDVIIAVDDHDVHSSEEYDRRVRDHTETSEIAFTVIRDAEPHQLTVKARPFPLERADALAWQLIGVELQESRGALHVTRVRPGSPAARIGFEVGDLVVGLGGLPVKNLDDFRRKMVDLRLAQTALVSIQRGPYLYHVPVPFGGNA